MLIAVWLRRQMAQGDGGKLAPGREGAAERLVRAYCTQLNAEFRSGKTMADFALAMNVTPTHLSRVCKSVSGRTAAALLTERVLHETRHRLQSGSDPIQQIARELGFGSAAYFTRFVRQQTGHTPSALRSLAQTIV